MKLQVDDTHELYINGQLKSKGSRWSHAYTVSNVRNIQTLALYADNTYGGPKGIMLTIGGKPVRISTWKCQTVASKAETVTKYKGFFKVAYNDAKWGKAVAIKGPKKSFGGAPWFWSKAGGNKCICRLNLRTATSGAGASVELQVDDEHKLWDSTGKLISQGKNWLTNYKSKGSGRFFALYAQNNQGLYSINMKVNGKPVGADKMKCRPVSGTLSQIDAKYKGWKTQVFNDKGWGDAEKSAKPAPAKVPGTVPLWAQCGCSSRVICRIRV